MRIDDEQQSSNFEDHRGSGGGGFGGGMGPIAIGGGGLGAVVLVVLGMLFGVNPGDLMGGGQGGAPSGYQQQGYAPGDAQVPASTGGAPSGSADEDTVFARRVLTMTERVWTEVLGENGARYTPPKLVVYSGADQTGCGTGQSAMGPFYCPADQKVYLDLSFFQELSGRFGAPGRFAEAYVIAHEVGHHVQNLLGTSDKVDAARRRVDRREGNQLSVRLELQADCYAGVWANRANRQRTFLEPGDVEQGLKAASSVGDDTLQRQTQGRVVPDAFTHGTSAQRTHWFTTGFQAGDIRTCDTFNQGYSEL